LSASQLVTESKIKFDFWACQRPLTHHWGSGQVFCRFEKTFGKVDVAFGKQDQIPDGVFAVDLNTGYNWLSMPMFKDNQFKRGYCDTPYVDEKGKAKLFKKEIMEIWRCCQELAILHTYIFPRAWLNSVSEAERIGMVAVTMGPMKQIRCLQVFRKAQINHAQESGKP
jgi:hypothetical protein